MSIPVLTKNSVARIHRKDTSMTPILQVMDARRCMTKNQGERWRLILSDGDYFIQSLLTTQLVKKLSNSMITKNQVIQLTEYVTNVVNGKVVCVIIDCVVLASPDKQIGAPKLYVDEGHIPSHSQQNLGRNNPRPSQAHSFLQQNVNDGSSEEFQPVASLNPYQTGWTIKVRCTNKEEIRHYSNQRGDGKVFSVDLLDVRGGEIRATMFNDVVDKFYPLFSKGSVYVIRKGQVKVARKGYTHIKNDYNIILNLDSEVTQADSDCGIKSVRYSFVRIADVQQVDEKDYVDIIGLVSQVGPVGELLTRKQVQVKKRTITLCDKTAKIEVTLWNEEAEGINDDLVGSVMAIKGARVSGFGGRSLNPGRIELHPQHPEASLLKMWWDENSGQAENMQSLTTRGAGPGASTRMTLQEVIDANLGMSQDLLPNSDKPKSDYFTTVGTIASIIHSTERPPWYRAVPETEKDENVRWAKVEEDGNGKWQCMRNSKVYESYTPRYIMRFAVHDCTNNAWMTAFDEAATSILTKPAKELDEYLKSGDYEAFEKVFKDACFKRYIFKCRARSDTWEDQIRVKYEVLGVQLANGSTETAVLIDKIRNIRKAPIMS